MTRIGVLSDTHLREPEPDLGQRLAQVWGPVDMILHAGDLVNISVLDALQAPEVLAVAGNMDDYVVRQSQPAQ